MHRAESLAASGKYVEAIAIYRDLLAQWAPKGATAEAA
jgi:hypothetical protein